MNTIDAVQGKQVWNSAKVVQSYAAEAALQKPEQTILNFLKDQLPNMRMLDLGIGGGRSTVHFAPLVKEYVGSDYAENMLDACRQRFPNLGKHARLELIDATAMTGVPDQYFDFVLFSYNGIDCVPPEDRAKVLQEVRRVGKKGGYFMFSTHNIRYVKQIFKLRWRSDMREFLYQFYRLPLLYYYNGFPGKYEKMDYAVVRNGIEHFSLTLYYSKPEYQVQQLKDLGFRNIRAFSRKTGKELELAQLHHVKDDAWIHYLCEI